MTSTPSDPNEPFGAGQPAYPGPQQPAAPYGSYPTGPGGQPPQRPAAPTQPSSIALAVKLMLVGAALSVISLVYSFATIGSLKDDIRTELMKNDVDVSQSTIDAAYAVTITIAVVFGLIGALLWVWMAWKNGQGRSWARVVATILGVLNIVGLLFTIAGSNAETISVILSVVSSVLAVVILVLLWKKESSAFYDATAASRQLY
ncbi:hypothetical protein IFT73_16610 [Aeromicrobium sp. CFBP 8757]|uniref:proline-rich domain-containing protein n=1 Tax=Aeromicrobium sp. CFBP 8757 TaxID=2775288 RepID=UPI0017838B59|nr:proline-rich domain-containing protein [Aeromicrobium sp. CFBP 8757]MBD8608480.1 hypothetical protein [Aeromicrobium sp. CFBP 8757]